MDLRYIGLEIVDWIDLDRGRGQVVGCFENGAKGWGSVKYEKFVG
jgi:hypothetical protein